MKEIKLKTNHLDPQNNTPFIRQYLNNLGITGADADSFIYSPRPSDEADPRGLCNIQKAVETVYQMLSKGNQHVFIVVDSDTDGYTSSAIAYSYLSTRFPNNTYTWKLHPGKEHGIVLEDIPEDVTLVIVPDAGSNDYEQQKILCNQGKTVIILDHHEIEDIQAFETSPAIIVNNQTSPNFSNHCLSGAGVAYKFIQLMDETYFSDTKIYQTFCDLAAIGIIADLMNMTNLDNNFIAYHGLSHINNKFIKELAIKQSRGIKNPAHLTNTDVSFYIAPVINGVIRSGEPQDKEDVFSAMITYKNDTIFPHSWRGSIKMETLWERAARNAINAKGRQDSTKRKMFAEMCERIKEQHLDQHNIIIITLTDEDKINANMTGLIAMELTKEFNKPCLVLRKTTYNNQSMFGGSGRNGTFYNLPDLKHTLNEAGVYYTAGHANAMGCFLLPEQINSVQQYFDSHLSAGAFDKVYEVDYWFHTGETISTRMLRELASYPYLWSSSIKQPLLAFSLTFDASQVVYMGKDQTSLKIVTDNIDFVAFNNQELIQLIADARQNSKLLHLDFIGVPQINQWQDKERLQIIISDFTLYKPTTVSLLDLI